MFDSNRKMGIGALFDLVVAVLLVIGTQRMFLHLNEQSYSTSGTWACVESAI